MTTLTDDEKHKQYVAHTKAFLAHVIEFGLGNSDELPTLPEGCQDMQCGAKTRSGHPCKMTIIRWNGRCKYHDSNIANIPKYVVYSLF